MTDTHTHLYLPEFGPEGEAAFQRAIESGVEHLIMPNVDESTCAPLLSMQRRHPTKIFTAWGLHPTEVRDDWQSILNRILPLLDEPGCVAVGEVGIDLYWDKTYRREQLECFAFQLGEASRRQLSLIIHCREGLDEALDVLSACSTPLPRLVFHSFTGSSSDAERILRIAPEAFFGINGVVTFKNAGDLREALPTIGINRIVLETDSPYLAPVPYRGKRNESAYIVAVRDKVAETLGMTPEETERITDDNALQLFPRLTN